MLAKGRVSLQDNPDYEDRVRTLLIDLEEQSKCHLGELHHAHENYRQALVHNARLQKAVADLKTRLDASF